MSLQDALAHYIPAIDREILKTVDAAGDCGLYDLARYQLGWMDQHGARLPVEEAHRHGGKKLRPAMTLLSCAACGGDWLDALPVAAAIELIHNFSLVHDDVEDGDQLRRHRLTVWGAFGVPKAVNCGSAMQALVYRAVLNLEHRRLPPGTAIQLVRLVTDAILEMTEGQHLDIDFQERGHISVDQYFDMTSRKTGALLEAALRSGARIAGAQSDYEEALARFGRSFGLAFQARDDYLGVWGDSRESGKAVGADIQRKKKSLPVVFGMEQDPGGAGALIRRVMALDSISGDDIAAVIEVLDSCGAREFTEEAAVRHTRAARIALSENLPESSAREALLEIAELAAMRRV